MSRVQTYASLWRASWQLRYLVTPEPGVQVSLRIFPPGALAIADEVIEFAIVLCCDCYAGLPLLVGWLGALENTDGMGTHLPKHFGQARLVAHQATDFTTIHVVELVHGSSGRCSLIVMPPYRPRVTVKKVFFYPIARHCVGMPTWLRTGETKGRRTMRVLLRDLVLFSCLLAFVTGIVIAVASLLS